MGISVLKRRFLKVFLFLTVLCCISTISVLFISGQYFSFRGFIHDYRRHMFNISNYNETIGKQDDYARIGREQYLVLGKQRLQKNFLTIGISSVRRPRDSYLLQTLSDLVNKSTHEEQENVTIVLFLADFNCSFRQEMSEKITSMFALQLNSGFLQVIQAPSATYPPLTNLRRTFGDDASHVRWRSKQVVDVAYLFDYCRGMSEYYLIMEDDIKCTSKYITKIRNYVLNAANETWLTINFTKFLIIGMLFRTEHLERLPQFLKMFYSAKPVDLLILNYFDLLVPEKNSKLKSPTALFQHVGVYSTLINKWQNLTDPTFVQD